MHFFNDNLESFCLDQLHDKIILKTNILKFIASFLCLHIGILIQGNSLHGQRCGGSVNFNVQVGRSTSTVQFRIPGLQQKKSKSVPGSRPRFSLKAKGEGTLLHLVSDGYDFLKLDFGCSQEMKLQITNLQTCQQMRIHFVNLCDTQFGMEIPFRKGTFEVNVCKRLADLKANGKQCNAGWDISADLRKR